MKRWVPFSWAPGAPIAGHYGMGTMKLPHSDVAGQLVGHEGATYGFYSYTVYLANLDLAFAITTNQETAPMHLNLKDWVPSILATLIAAVRIHAAAVEREWHLLVFRKLDTILNL